MLPGAQTQRASYYIAQKGKYQTFATIIDGNNLFFGDQISVQESHDVNEELGKLATELGLAADKVFDIGITPSGESNKRSFSTKV